MIYGDGFAGAGADAGATAVTLFGVDLRGTHLTTSWPEPDGVRFTTVFTAAALYAGVGQALGTDFYVLPPGLFSFWPEQRLITNCSALIAKSAFTAAEIDSRETTITPGNDLGFAVFDAGVTAVTVGKEQLFILDPGKVLAKRFSGLISGHLTSEECPTAQIDHEINFPEVRSESGKSRQ